MQFLLKINKSIRDDQNLIQLFDEIGPVNPPKVELKGKPIIKYNGVIKEKGDDRIVASQFNILIPVGIAIIEVGKEK